MIPLTADVWSALLLFAGVGALVAGLLLTSTAARTARWLGVAGTCTLAGGIALTILGVIREVTR
jgi:hypothetical protein